MMLFIENVKLALTAIKSNKMRSFLTMLGIIIGISSVIAITSIGNSAKGAVEKEFEGIGKGYFYISTNWQKFDEVYESDLFSDYEMEAIAERFSDEIGYIAPYRYLYATYTTGNKEKKITLYGVAENYEKYCKKIIMVSGRMINSRDIEGKRANAVIHVDDAKRIFGKTDVLGKKVEFKTGNQYREYTIVGVYETKAGLLSGMGMGEPTRECYVPHVTAEKYSGEPAHYIELYAKNAQDVDRLGKEITNYVIRIKDAEPESYIYESAEAQVGQINNVLGILSIAIGAIAAISLLVGGIGIMNIMLVSVTERTREIGIRKSLGARTKDIMTQFLIEAMILSVIGGIIGTLLGIGIAALGMTIAKVGLVINIGAVIGAVLFSAAVGLFFGLFPAKKAAKLDPIEALRYE